WDSFQLDFLPAPCRYGFGIGRPIPAEEGAGVSKDSSRSASEREKPRTPGARGTTTSGWEQQRTTDGKALSDTCAGARRCQDPSATRGWQPAVFGKKPVYCM